MGVSASYAACERLARAKAANFYPAFLVLPRPQRRAMYALYAFNRLTDDIADEPGNATNKRRMLDEWQMTLDAVNDGKQHHQYLSALADVTSRFGVPRQCYSDVIDGCRKDLDAPRFDRFAELYEYCRQVASSVGLACIHIWGFRDTKALCHAEAAGVALQLTNILRDLGEDRERGRVYLPQEELDRFGVHRETLCADVNCPAFQQLMKFQVDRARRYYDAARDLEDSLSFAGRAVFRVILGIYRRLLEHISLSGFDVLSRRITVPRSEKVRIAVGALPTRWGWASG